MLKHRDFAAESFPKHILVDSVRFDNDSILLVNYYWILEYNLSAFPYKVTELFVLLEVHYAVFPILKSL